MNTTISEAHATGEEISLIIDKIEPVLMGESRAHAIIASLSIALMLQKPDLSPTEVVAGVQAVSEFMCLFLSAVDDENVAKANGNKVLLN